jgi:hypothetical protein
MTSDELMRQPYAVHVGVDDDLLAGFVADARSADVSVINLDLSGVSDRAALAAYLSEAFMFPHEARGLDAAIDLISDLEWFGSAGGYLVVVDGLDRAPNAVEPFASILPNIVDRWRSQARPFIVAIRASCDRLTSALATANRRMEEAGSLPWAQPGTGVVDVILHNEEELGLQE